MFVYRPYHCPTTTSPLQLSSDSRGLQSAPSVQSNRIPVVLATVLGCILHTLHTSHIASPDLTRRIHYERPAATSHRLRLHLFDLLNSGTPTITSSPINNGLAPINSLRPRSHTHRLRTATRGTSAGNCGGECSTPVTSISPPEANTLVSNRAWSRSSKTSTA